MFPNFDGHLRFCIFWTKEWPNTEASESYLGSSWKPLHSRKVTAGWPKMMLWKRWLTPLKKWQFLEIIYVRFLGCRIELFREDFDFFLIFCPPPPNTPQGKKGHHPPWSSSQRPWYRLPWISTSVGTASGNTSVVGGVSTSRGVGPVVVVWLGEVVSLGSPRK